MASIGFVLLLGTSLMTAQPDTLPEKKIDDVVVTGTRVPTTPRHLPITVSVVERAELTALQRPSILPTLSEQVPGLFVTQRSMMGYGVSTGAAGGMTLRGVASGTGQMLVLVDGHPQYNGIYGHSLADSYHTLMAERVEVLRGPASVLYGGNAMGGIVNIVTRQCNSDGSDTHVHLGAGSWGTVQAEASNQYRHGKFSSMVGAQYGRTDNHRPNMGFQQYGGSAKLTYALSSHWRAYADANVTHFTAHNPGSVQSPLHEAEQNITRAVASLVAENHYGRTSGSASLYTNYGRHHINDGHAPSAAPQGRLFQSRDAVTGLSLSQNAELWRGSLLTLGIDYQHIYGRAWYTSRATGETLDTPNKQSGRASMHEVAAYVDLRQELTDWLTLDAGVRYDHHSVAGGEWVPQAGIVARPIAAAEARLMVGKGFRNPTMREMYLYPPSNEDLRPERLWNYELSWRHRLLQGRLSYGANLYLIRGDNVIQTVNFKNVNTGEISNRGIELEAAWRVNAHWSLSTNHSFLYMEHAIVGAPRYAGYLSTRMHYGQWRATVGLQQVCGLSTAVSTSEDHRETFTLLNATVSYQLLRQLQLWVSGDNLLCQRYETLSGYPMPRATVMAGVNVHF